MRHVADLALAENDRLAIERAAAILREQFDVEQVILFGSKARGDDRSDSDIDLLVLTRGTVSNTKEDEITDALFDLQLQLGVVISTLIVPAAEWDGGLYQVLPVKHAVDQEGVAA